MSKPGKVFLLLVVAAGAFLAGAWYDQRKSNNHTTLPGRQILYYHDPMHPAYKSDKPGVAPDCGMQLEPVYAGDASATEGTEGSGSQPPGTGHVGPDRQQLIGVKVATVAKAPGNYTIRVLGRVVPDETRIYRINSATEGWVREILPVTTGSLVKKDELLANIYAPETASAMKAYLYGLRSMDRFKADKKETKEQIELTDSTIDNYRNALRNQGMTEHQLDEIMRSRQGANTIEIRSPAAGFILARNISLGQRFERGAELYRIADLSHVWILADLFGREARQIHPGMRVRVSLADQGFAFTAKTSNILPQFDPVTRTLKVRLEAENPYYDLRPDMFVDVEYPILLPASVAVPTEAVIDSGLQKRVYVNRGNGFFEPRQVETGWRFGDRVQIMKGLEPGESVVVSGNFLLDSESRMKAAAQTQPIPKPQNTAAHPDPVCGMDVDPAKVEGKSEFGGKTYYFCSRMCKEKFDKNPQQYAGKTVVSTNAL